MTAPTLTRMADDDTAIDTDTGPAPELAWALDNDEPEQRHKSWSVASIHAGILILGATVAVGVIGMIGSTMRQPPATKPAIAAPAATTTVTIAAAPAPTPASPSPSATTTPGHDDGDGAPGATFPSLVPPAPDDQFIAWLNADGMRPTDRKSTVVNGRYVCELFAQGATSAQIGQRTQVSTGLPSFAATDFVSIAVNAYCPQYSGMLVK